MSEPNLEFSLRLAEIAWDSYQVILTDEQFQAGYSTLNGQALVQANSLSDWLTQKSYTLVNNPDLPPADREMANHGVIYQGEDMVVVAMRGTIFSPLSHFRASVHDAYTDLVGAQNMFGQVTMAPFAYANQIYNDPPDKSDMWLHAGFYVRYTEALQSIHNTLTSIYSQPNPPGLLFFTGHSLGGALAQIGAVDAGLNLVPHYGKMPVPDVYTFASPLVGNQFFQQTYDENIGNSFLFENHNDRVPLVPVIGTPPLFFLGHPPSEQDADPESDPPTFRYVKAETTFPISSCAGALSPLSAHALTSYNAGIETAIMETKIGNSWTKPQKTNFETEKDPILCANADKLVLAWRDKSSSNLFISSYTPNEGWSSAVNTNQNTPHGPGLAYYNNAFWVFFQDSKNNILYSKLDTSLNLAEVQTVPDNAATNSCPAAVTFAGRIFLGYEGTSSLQDNVYQMTASQNVTLPPSNTLSFTPQIQILQTGASQDSPSWAVAGEQLFMVHRYKPKGNQLFANQYYQGAAPGLWTTGLNIPGAAASHRPGVGTIQGIVIMVRKGAHKSSLVWYYMDPADGVWHQVGDVGNGASSGQMAALFPFRGELYMAYENNNTIYWSTLTGN